MQDANLTIRLPQPLKDKFKDRAALEDRSISEIVVRVMSQAATRWTPTGKKEA
jgi:hypothetical protein